MIRRLPLVLLLLAVLSGCGKEPKREIRATSAAPPPATLGITGKHDILAIQQHLRQQQRLFDKMLGVCADTPECLAEVTRVFADNSRTVSGLYAEMARPLRAGSCRTLLRRRQTLYAQWAAGLDKIADAAPTGVPEVVADLDRSLPKATRTFVREATDPRVVSVCTVVEVQQAPLPLSSRQV